MRCLLAGVMILGCLADVSRAEIVVALENFDGGTPSWTNDIATQVFVDPSSPNQGLFVQQASDANANFSGLAAFGRDLEGEGAEPSLDPYNFTFSAVDVTGLSGVLVSFDYAVSANADIGSYILVLDGNEGSEVEFYNDPDSGVVADTVLISVPDSASTVGLRLTGTLNGASDTLELDNFRITAVPEPSSFACLGLLTAGATACRRRRVNKASRASGKG